MGGGGKSGAQQSQNYFASIAGIICQGQLDFIWGLCLQDYLVWPSATVVNANDPWPSSVWPANSIIAWNGIVYETPSSTSVQPPGAPWVRFRVNSTDAGVTNPYKITVPNFGDTYLYWGTATQNLDSVNEAFLTQYGHPPYRNRAVLACKDFLFGQSSDASQPPPCPSMIVLGGRNPVQSLITGASAALDGDWQANPWCVLAELLTHPIIGLGRVSSEFHAASWQAEADRCQAIASLTYISPIYDTMQKVRSVISDILQYVDSFIYRGTDGLIHAGHWPHGEAPPAWSSANTIDRNVLVKEIADESDGWEGTSNVTQFDFDDINAAFKSNTVLGPNTFNRQIMQELLTRNVSRPFVVRINQATAWATEDAKIAGDQTMKGTLTVRAERAAAIVAGSHFLLTDDDLGLSFPMRCNAKTVKAPPVGLAEIEFELERAYSDQPYSATPPVQPVGSKPAPARIVNFRLVEIPDSLAADGNQFSLACLAARSNQVTNSFDVWWRSADGAAFESLATLNSFAISATMNGSSNGADVVNEAVTSASVQGTPNNLANQDLWNLTLQYSSDGGTTWTTGTENTDYVIDYVNGTATPLVGGAITNGDSVRVSYSIYILLQFDASTPVADIEQITQSLTADEILNNTILLFGFQAANAELFEVLSIKALTALGAGAYKATVKRVQYSTLFGGDGSHVWNTGDGAMLVFRSGIYPLGHLSFESLCESAGTATFRLVPSSLWQVGDENDVYNATTNPGGLTTEFSYTFYDPYAPVVSWEVLDDNGTTITDFTLTYLTTDTFQFIFNISSLAGDLASARLVARFGGQELLLWSQILSGSSQIADVAFSIPTEGDYNVVAVISNQAGRVVEYPLTQVGSSTPVVLMVRKPGSGIGTTQVANPVMTSQGTTSPAKYTFAISDSTAGSTIYFQLQIGFGPFNPGSWLPYSSPVLVPPAKTLFTYATKTGLTDSTVVSFSNSLLD